jgi:hypothetical protein
MSECKVITKDRRQSKDKQESLKEKGESKKGTVGEAYTLCFY